MFVTKPANSTQKWLNEHKLCPECRGQKPKSLFHFLEGRAICEDCKEEALLEAA